MKIAILILTLLAACARPGSVGAPASSPVDAGTTGAHAKGGVDVGNMKTGLIPDTHVVLNFPSTWNAQNRQGSLALANSSGSSVTASLSDIKDIASPSAPGLQAYLNAKFPSRHYDVVSVNGLDGVRADLVDTKLAKTSDVYLISELKDFVHIETHLQANDNGIVQGDLIVLSARVKYQGLAFTNQSPRTIELQSGSDYSFKGDCYSNSAQEPVCRDIWGVGAFMRGNSMWLGTAGADTGRIVDLGSIALDSVNVSGDSLVAPTTTVALADIYTMFTPKNQKPDQDHLELVAGHTYLVRTISWPDEDIVTKMHVDSIGATIKLSYEKLVYVPEAQLKSQIEAINEYTKKYEQPLVTGEAVLYDREATNNYFYASFNFEYSTSGNPYIVYNGWDLMYETRGGPELVANRTGSGVANYIDLGTKDLAAVADGDFTDPNHPINQYWTPVVGHTYAIDHYEYSDTNNSHVRGAIQILEIGPSAKWIRFKFRRMLVAAADHFQKWIELQVPAGVQTVTLDRSDWSKAQYLPFIGKRADQGRHYYEHFYLEEEGRLRTDSRPFNNRGFIKLPAGTAFENVAVTDLNRLSPETELTVAKGDVTIANFENYYDRTVDAVRVDEVTDTTVTLSIRTLVREKTVFSDDGN